MLQFYDGRGRPAASGGCTIQEIELKLRMAPATLQRLRRHAVVRSLARGRSRSRRLSSTYYDTPDGFLRRAGMALRLRRDGDSVTQTLKAPAALLRALGLPQPALAEGREEEGAGRDTKALDALGSAEAAAGLGSGLQSFAELNAAAPGDAPALELLEHEGLRRYLRDHGIAARLEPLFVTEFERRSLPLVLADSSIELCLDEGEIRAGDRRLPLCEAELELLSGRPARLFELALLLAEKLGFQLETRTKAERGHALLTEQTPEPVFASLLELAPETSAAEAFETMARSALAQMRANEPAMRLDRDPEGLHQFRVGLRRLRALVSLYKAHLEPGTAAFLRDELRWLQQETGPARDWDVFLLDTLGPMRRRLPDEAALGPLAESSAAARDAAAAQAVALLDDPRYTRLLLRLQLLLADGGWRLPPAAGRPDPLQGPARALAGRLLSRGAAKLDKLGRGRRAKSEAELHQIRIAAKKLRYAADFFRNLYPKKAVKAYARPLKELQDRLGSLNDAAVGHRLVDGLALNGMAAGMVIGWQAARIEADLPRFAETWKSYKAARAFWK